MTLGFIAELARYRCGVIGVGSFNVVFDMWVLEQRELTVNIVLVIGLKGLYSRLKIHI